MKDAGLWNDPISEFIRIKAENPQAIAQLVRNEKEFDREWKKGRKLEEEKEEYESARREQQEELKRMKEVVARKQALHRQMSTISSQIHFLEMQLEKGQGDTDYNHRQSGRSDKSGWSQSSEVILKEIQVKIQQLSHRYQQRKSQHMHQVDQLLEIKKGVSKQKERTEVAIQDSRSKDEYIKKQREQNLAKLRQEHQVLTKENDRLMQGYSEQLKKSELKKRNVENLQDLVERSREKLESLVRELHKFILSGDVITSRKAGQLRQKCSPYLGDREYFIKNFQNLIAAHPSVHFIDTRRDGSFNHYGQELPSAESLINETPGSSPKKRLKRKNEMVELEGIMSRIAELDREQNQQLQQIALLKQTSDRKTRELELERSRLKSTR